MPDIDRAFAYNKPDADQLARMQELRVAYTALKRSIQANVPSGRECSVALTELETSAMWAMKAISHEYPGEPTLRG